MGQWRGMKGMNGMKGMKCGEQIQHKRGSERHGSERHGTMAIASLFC